MGCGLDPVSDEQSEGVEEAFTVSEQVRLLVVVIVVGQTQR
jgi:hypothetical protein